MNKFIFKGNLSKDIEQRATTEGKMVAQTSIAVKRDFKNAQGVYEADFFNITAFGKTAEVLYKLCKKGQELLVEGRIQNKTWEDQTGAKRYSTDYIVERIEFCGSAKKEESKTSENTTGDFITVEEAEELPF